MTTSSVDLYVPRRLFCGCVCAALIVGHSLFESSEFICDMWQVIMIDSEYKVAQNEDCAIAKRGQPVAQQCDHSGISVWPNRSASLTRRYVSDSTLSRCGWAFKNLSMARSVFFLSGAPFWALARIDGCHPLITEPLSRVASRRGRAVLGVGGLSSGPRRRGAWRRSSRRRCAGRASRPRLWQRWLWRIAL